MENDDRLFFERAGMSVVITKPLAYIAISEQNSLKFFNTKT